MAPRPATGSRLRHCARLGPGLLLVLALAAPLQGQQGAGDPARVQELFAAGEYGAALGETQQLADATLAAEWRCYLHLAGGDFPGALEAAEAGLEQAPEHQGLLVNAIGMTLALGLAERAELHARTLLDVLEARPDASPDELERAHRLLGDARAAAGSLRRAQAGRTRAQWVVLAVSLVSLAAMLWLARRVPLRALSSGS